MIKLIVKQYLFDPGIIAWAVLPIVFFLYVIIFGDLNEIAASRFEVVLNERVSINSSNLILQFQVLIFFLSIVTFPKFFLESTDPQRISLVISKDISKVNYLMITVISYLAIALFYSVLSMFIFLMLNLLTSELIYFNFILALLLTPLFITSILTYVIFFCLSTKSYGLTVFLSFFFGLVLSPGFHLSSTTFVNEINDSGIRNIVIQIGMVCKYSLPDVYGLMNIIADFSKGKTVKFLQLIFSILSLIPIFFLSIYLFLRKEY